MRVIRLDEPARHGWRVRATVARDPDVGQLRGMLARARSGLRALVGSDGSLYAWDADEACHIDVARALGFDHGDHRDLRVVADGDDPFEGCDEWSLGDGDRVVDGVRVLRGSTPWDAAPLRALGFDRAAPARAAVAA